MAGTSSLVNFLALVFLTLSCCLSHFAHLQWSASTGADPQPYFRIFNMKSQGEKSDSNGDYVKYWVPELADVPVKNIHEPTSAQRKKAGYPEPMVDHKESRERALRRFKEPGSR